MLFIHNMDKLCNKSETEVKNLNRTIDNKGEEENVRSSSPVFKCFHSTKTSKGSHLDSSDYDIPSYQANQSFKSRTSSKCANETNDSVLLFSPIFSPIRVISNVQFQPPSIHSVGTVVKNSKKALNQTKESTLNKEPEQTIKPSGVFENLGMTDRDISWVSSMATPPPKQVPGSEFNTIEKATFFPEEKFQNIQPRALFSPPLDEDFDCQPIIFTSESEDNDEEYKSNMRLSDVCSTLKQLEVKSLEHSDNLVNKVIIEKDYIISPIIRTKKNKMGSTKKTKKCSLVISPKNNDKYEFSASENLKMLESEKVKSNFLEDDSFQSMSFSGIDELCRTLVTDQSTSTTGTTDCDKTIIDKTLVAEQSNTSNLMVDSDKTTIKDNISKKFYTTKATNDVYTVSNMDDIHSYVKALEEGDKCNPTISKIDQPLAERGIVRLDVLNKETKSDSTKRLHSEIFEESDMSQEKKMKKADDDWENVKHYLSESQLNVSDGEIFRTVENLEKTLASQESKDLEKLNSEIMTDTETTFVKLDTKLSGETNEMEVSKNTSQNTKVPLVEYTTPFSEKSMNEPKEILNCDKHLKIDNHILINKFGNEVQKQENIDVSNESLMKGFSTGLGNGIKISTEAMKKDKLFKSECEVSEEISGNNYLGKTKRNAFSTGYEKSIEEELKKPLLLEFGEDAKKAPKDAGMPSFSTGLGRKIQVSAKALEKAKALMLECDKNLDLNCGTIIEKPSTTTSEFGESSKSIVTGEKILESALEENRKEDSNMFKGFSTGSGKTIQVSGKALERAKALLRKCESEFNEKSDTLASHWLVETPDPPLSGNGKTSEEPESSKPYLTTASSNKEKSTDEALKSAKESGCKITEDSGNAHFQIQSAQIGFQTAGGSKVIISETALAKAKQLMNEWNKINEDFGDLDSITEKPSMKNFSVQEKVTPKPCRMSVTSEINESDEWEEIIPSWLHVYSTSPSIASERVELSPVLSHEDGKTSKPEREYIVKSPVLGSSDRFHRRTKRRKLRFEDEKKFPQKNDFVSKNYERKTSAKRTSNLPLDFSVPFKKLKYEEKESVDGLDITPGRARAREEQEKAVKEKQKVKPLKGSHLSRKCTEKQMSWNEAVAGSSPQQHSDEDLRSLGVSEDVLKIHIENALSFRFKGEDYFGSTCTKNLNGFPVGDGAVLILDDYNKFGVEEIKRAFLASPGVQPSLVPQGWVENHYKWIIWKLAHYEKSFPNHFGGKCLNPNQIMLQLKYRYDREIDRSERSALKKILERDDTSIKRMVLCVCGIKKIIVGEMVGYELKLTDGWYSCPARLDPAMTRLIEEGKILIGTKLLTQGATLVNCEQGVSPLEINEDVYLKISTNSTRRIRWDSKLGFQKNPENFPISLGSILPQGGAISRIDVIIVRIYPTLYMEKTSDGRHVTRNRRSEEKAESEYRKLQEERMEAIYSEIESEMKKSASKIREEKNSNKFAQDDGLMESSSNPLQELNQNDHFNRELRERVNKAFEKEKLNKRNVSEFLRAKIVDFKKPDFNNPALLSLWNPNEDLTGLINEGKVISIMNVTIGNSSKKYKPIQINTTRQTQYRQITQNVKYPARKLTKLKDVSSKVCPAFEEMDVVGMVTLIQDVSYGSRLSQVVYLTDLEMNFVGIVFWGSCKDYSWENVLRIPYIVACSNLQWNRNTHQDVPLLYVSENSVFTENPKHTHLKEEIERLKKILPQEKNAFLSKCEEELTSKLEDSKWRSKTNPSAKDSTLRESKFRIVNGFESNPTASSTPIKPFPSRIVSDEPEPSPIQKRIEKLQCYGEPPSLIPLPIKNNIKRKFKKNSRPFTNQ